MQTMTQVKIDGCTYIHLYIYTCQYIYLPMMDFLGQRENKKEYIRKEVTNSK